jgi:hypothetical protein
VFGNAPPLVTALTPRHVLVWPTWCEYWVDFPVATENPKRWFTGTIQEKSKPG